MKKQIMFALVLLPTTALADPAADRAKIQAALDKCSAGSPAIEKALACADKVAARALKYVDDYSKYAQKFFAKKDAADFKELLENTNRTWGPFVDADCALEARTNSDDGGGQIVSMLDLECRVRSSLAQAAKIEKAVRAVE